MNVDQIVKKLIDNQTNEVEDFLQSFAYRMGLSPEELAEEYVLEEHPEPFHFESLDFATSSDTKVSLRTTYVLRKMSDEEKLESLRWKIKHLYPGDDWTADVYCMPIEEIQTIYKRAKLQGRIK